MSLFFTCTDSSGDDESMANNRETVKQERRCKKVERDERVPAKVKPFSKIYRWSSAAARREMKSVKELFLPPELAFPPGNHL